MQLTVHGVERAQMRTKMHVNEVRSIIASDAVADLGSSGEYSYLLFYALRDGTFKIAVTTRDRGSLISIWDQDFHLPENVEKVNTRHRRRALRALASFMPQSGNQLRAQTQSHTIRWYLVRIEVCVNGKVEYAHEAGTFPIATIGKRYRKTLVEMCRHELEKITSVVEANIAKANGKPIGYRICLVLKGRVVKRHYLMRTTLFSYLRAV